MQIGGGLGIGGSIHIGNLLGANQPHKAKVSAYILLVLAGKAIAGLKSLSQLNCTAHFGDLKQKNW